MESNSTKTGIIYCRVSSSEQVENTSLESQERHCREYAKREGITIIAEPFIEKGESAKTADRTEFIKAINFCANKKHKVGYFIVYKLDRFARNQNDHVVTQATLRRYGVALRSVTEPIDETPIGRVMEGVISVFAEFDNNVRTERSKGGMLEKIKKGIWVWQAPLGFYRPYQGSNIVPEDSTSFFIRMIFEEYAKGSYTYQSLADYVAARGFKTKNGKLPRAQIIEKILRNPLYCGIIKVWEQEIKADFGIVSEDLFNQCQKGFRRGGVKINRSKNNPLFPLRRICVCPECKTSLTGSSSTGRMGVKYAYYHHHKQVCIKSQFIPKETFEQLFVEYLDEITPSGKYEKMFKVIVLDIWQNNYKKLDENNVKVRSQITRLEQDRQKVFDMHREGKYSDDEFTEQKSLINQTITEKQLLLQDNFIEGFNMEEALDHCFQFIRETAKTWLRLKEKNYDRLMRFQKQVFPEKITFDGEKFGTTNLSLIYKINKENGSNKSQMVTLQRIEL
jgi:site-specific DNA recombinase